MKPEHPTNVDQSVRPSSEVVDSMITALDSFTMKPVEVLQLLQDTASMQSSMYDALKMIATARVILAHARDHLHRVTRPTTVIESRCQFRGEALSGSNTQPASAGDTGGG